MDSVMRAFAIYAFLLVVFRILGRRSMADISTFDFVLLLIIGEATQQAQLGNDFSVTNACLVIATLLIADVGLSLLKRASPRMDRLLEGVPLVLVEDGRPRRELMHRARVDDSDILQAARDKMGLERMEDIKYAVLERSGGISIIPLRSVKS